MGPEEKKIRGFVRDGHFDREAAAAELARFLDLLIAGAQFELRYRIETRPRPAGDVESPELLVDFDGPDKDLLLEHNAALLLAIEYLAVRWLGLTAEFYDYVRLDAGDFRSVRAEELRVSARLAAEKVRDLRQPFPFQPMSARERRIVHLALRDFPGVRTASEGAGEHRHLVIYPAERK